MTDIIIITCLLFVFIIAIFYTQQLEGFITFENKTPLLNKIYIKEYSDTSLVYKIYDSIYFDSGNSNVIQLFGTEMDEKKMDQSTAISDIVVLSRMAKKSSNMKVDVVSITPNTKTVSKELISDLTIDSYNYSMFPNTTSTLGKLTSDYQIAYISWGTDTILYVYNCNNKILAPIGTYLFREFRDPLHYLYKGGLSYDLLSMDARNHDTTKYDTYVTEPLYDPKKANLVFHITKNVLFDTSCGYLIIRHSGMITVYDGTLQKDGITSNRIYTNVMEAGKVKDTPFKNANKDRFETLHMMDIEGGNFVMYAYIPSTEKTLVVVFCANKSIPNLLDIVNVATFNSTTRNKLDGREDIPYQNGNNNNNNNNNNNKVIVIVVIVICTTTANDYIQTILLGLKVIIIKIQQLLT